MTDPVSSSAPPTAVQVTAALPPGQQQPQQQPQPNAQVINLPPPLQNIAQALSLSGQVVQTNTDGTVTIRTDQGNIDVKVASQNALVPGEKVDVQLPAGSPPQTATVTPETTQQPAQTPPQTPQTPSSSSAPTPAPPRGSDTPVEVTIKGPDAQPETPPAQYAPPPDGTEAPPPTPLTPQQPAQLEPITPEQAQAYVAQAQAAQSAPIESAPAPQATQAIEQVIIIEIPEANQIVTPQQQPATASPTAPSAPLSIPTTESVQPAANISNPAVTPSPLAQNIRASVQIFQGTQISQEPALNAAPSIIVPGAAKQTDFTQIQIPTKIFIAPPQAQEISPKFFTPGAAFPITPQLTVPANAPAPATGIPALIAKAQVFIARIAGEPTPGKQIQIPSPANLTAKDIKIPDVKESIPLILQNIKAGAVTGTVIAQTPEQFPVIAFSGIAPLATGKTQTEESFFILRIPTPDIPPGTQIPFLPSIATMPIDAALIPPPLSYLTPEPWALMDQIFQALAQAAPQTAQTFTNVIPSPATPQQLGPTAMLFIAAVQGGDLTQWLSDKVKDVLRDIGRTSLISRLTGEGDSLSRLSSQNVSQDWKAMSLPLYWENGIQKIALYYKHDYPSGGDKGKGGKQVRFIFDLSLDNMGKVQLDGLFRPKRLDLIVRTTQALSQPMQMNMRQAYINALEPTEVKGELSFQNKPEQWVTINPDREKFGAVA